MILIIRHIKYKSEYTKTGSKQGDYSNQYLLLNLLSLKSKGEL